MILGWVAFAQVAGRPRASKGPRAIGLLQLAPNGSARLTPVAIMVDGKFYDAGAYKANPIPMALESGTVYEAARTGTSQGLFTVTSVSQRQDTSIFVANGKWLPAGATEKKPGHTAEAKPNMGEADGPPKLRRGNTPGPAEKAPPAAPQDAAPPAAASGSAPVSSGSDHAKGSETAGTSPSDKDRPVLRRPSQPGEGDSGHAAGADVDTPAQEDPAPQDKDRPVLQRGAHPKPAEHEPVPLRAKKDMGAAKAAPHASPDNASKLQLLPAISDANGPEPRSFVLEVKPDEEAVFRKKALALASEQLDAYYKRGGASSVPPPSESKTRSSKARTRTKPPQAVLDDVQMRLFDLTSSNEPIVVLTATVQPGSAAGFTSAPPSPGFFTMVAREDIYGELHKVIGNITDAQHLDAIPKLELIDALDADGDGRGELLFRKSGEDGSAFVIYRIIGNQPWALFEGTPQ